MRHLLQDKLLASLVGYVQRRCRHLDRNSIEVFGQQIGAVLRGTAPQLRRDIRQALDYHFGTALSGDIERRVFEDQLGRLLVDSLLTWQCFDKHPYPFDVTLSGEDHLTEALAAGRGVVLVSGHYGNWELMSQWLAARGYPMHAVQRLHRNARLHERITRWRELNGARLIDFHRRQQDSFGRCLRVLREGKMLGLLVDIVPKTRALEVPFLGKNYAVPLGPALLSLLSGAALVPFFCQRTATGYRIDFLQRIPEPVGMARDAAAAAMSRQMALCVEQRILAHPDHWTWMLDAWRRRPFILPAPIPSAIK